MNVELLMVAGVLGFESVSISKEAQRFNREVREEAQGAQGLDGAKG